MAATVDPEYWCHQCNQTIVPIMGDEIRCSRCNGGFVEEMETPPPRQSEAEGGFVNPRLPALLSEGGLLRRRPENSDDLPPRVLVMEQPPIMMQLMQALGSALAGLQVRDEAELEGLEENGVVVVDPRGFPLLMFQGAGAPTGANAFGIPQVSGALGDYFIGPGLEQLLQRLAENDPSRYGTPPTAKEAVDSMPAVKITEEHLKADCSSECAVCKDDFAVGEETRQLPCKHLYHPDCILPWLKLHSSCPVCRFQMPTDEEGTGKSQSQESASASGISQNSGGSNNNNSGEEPGNGNGNRNNNRWFQISLPFSMISNLVNSAWGTGRSNNNEDHNSSNENSPN